MQINGKIEAMYPVLFSYGPFSLKTMTVFLIFSFLSMGFIFWKRGKEEHYNEMEIFDSFLFSFIFALFVSRIAYILLNFSNFNFDFIKWIDFISHPGSKLSFGLMAMSLALYRFARKKKWDIFEILDFWTQAVSLGLIFVYLGYFFDASFFGNVTSLPIGVMAKGVLEKQHPVQLYLALFYLLLFIYLSWLEFHYRTFEWYRFGKKSAQTGFLFCNFIIVNAIVHFGMSFLRLPEIVINDFAVERIIYIVFLILALILLWFRSGRSLLPSRKTRIWAKRQKI
ncbi:MAG: prolipoprotein diacylglyceryl transferase [Candidatus Woesebacteria bacterium]|jgi:phosphatidylglycerol:prolipoprotein diacylglycerol transferase